MAVSRSVRQKWDFFLLFYRKSMHLLTTSVKNDSYHKMAAVIQNPGDAKAEDDSSLKSAHK